MCVCEREYACVSVERVDERGERGGWGNMETQEGGEYKGSWFNLKPA